MCRRQLVDAAHGRQRRRDVAEREVGVQRLVIDLTRDLVVAEQRAISEAKLSTPSRRAVEQRLLADAVAGEEELLPTRVPEREREHAVELADAVDPMLLVEVGDDLRVALGGRACARAAGARPQLPVVVDLAVEDDATERSSL